MSIFGIFRKKKQIDSEVERQNFLRNNGRITDGVISDSQTTDSGEEIVSYVYSVQGVDFESSEILTKEQLQNSLKYAPGARVGVRYDPKNHGNSMLV
jgi:hypothetical protein